MCLLTIVSRSVHDKNSNIIYTASRQSSVNVLCVWKNCYSRGMVFLHQRSRKPNQLIVLLRSSGRWSTSVYYMWPVQDTISTAHIGAYGRGEVATVMSISIHVSKHYTPTKWPVGLASISYELDMHGRFTNFNFRSKIQYCRILNWRNLFCQFLS
jgi:hypothetical protein